MLSSPSVAMHSSLSLLRFSGVLADAGEGKWRALGTPLRLAAARHGPASGDSSEEGVAVGVGGSSLGVRGVWGDNKLAGRRGVLALRAAAW